MTETSASVEPVIPMRKGRSLWSDALRRLRANRAAVAAIVTLGLMAVVCIVGPVISPHAYDEVYQSYVKTRPSLEPYPTAAQIDADLHRALRRAKVDIDDFSVDGDTLTVRLSADNPIDPRMTRYIDRVDSFTGSHIVSEEDGGRVLVIEATVARAVFLAGTDQNGRDLLTRILIGGRVSLAIGLLATFVALLIGVAWGAVAGFVGGRIDQLMMRFVDVLYSLPFIFFVIMLVVFFGRNFILMFIAVGAVEWLDMARIVRGQTLSIKRQEYVEAARALGVSQWHIIWRHIVPNTLGPVVIYMTLLVPKVILLESFLSFLGLGVQEPMTSWGVLISEGAKNIQDAPYLLLFPSIFLAITLLCLNFIGDGLRDALDPKDR
ncbi:MAG: ABC transporter permease subunit [Geminicoccaceae bacterium]|nr:ABC transporter permease subunit [Geminicoccaceae bacterium]